MKTNPLGLLLLAAALIVAWILLKGDHVGARDGRGWGDDGVSWSDQPPCRRW